MGARGSRRLLTWVMAGALASSLTACVRVRAHQRSHLAKPAMDPQRDANEARMDEHVREYREGSIGGAGVGGGGCGCN